MDATLTALAFFILKKNMTGYELSRRWFNWSFENKQAKVQHTALYLWIVELNNRLGWKKEFGLPTNDTSEGLSIGNKSTYLSALKDLKDWGFIEVIKESKNQYQSCIISLCHYEIVTAQVTALDTALIQHSIQHCNGIGNGIGNGIAPIDKQINKETINKETINQETINSEKIEKIFSSDFQLLKNEIELLKNKLLEAENDKKNKAGGAAKKNTFDAKKCLVNDFEIDEVLADDFLRVRKAKNAPLTQTALTSIVKECEKHNFNLSEALKICCEKNWQGFKYEWLQNKKTEINGKQANYNKTGVWDAATVAADAIAKLRARREGRY